MTAHRQGVASVNRQSAACDALHTVVQGVKSILTALRKKSEREMDFKALCAAVVLIAVAMQAVAQGPSKAGVVAHLDVHKVVRAADGRESIVGAETAKPGDVLEYVVTYENVSRETIRNLNAMLPIPAATEFIPGSARPATATASLDARKFEPIPLKRKVLRDGRDVEEVVAYREYRYLSWLAPEIPPGKSLTFVARVKVIE